MRGVDVTASEIERATNFLKVSGNYPSAERFTTNRAGFIRLLAWYGCLRRDGDGSGHWVSKRAEDGKHSPLPVGCTDRDDGRHCCQHPEHENCMECCFCGEKATEFEPTIRAAVVHGKTCPKKPHGPRRGWLHDESDDTPYDIDGVNYCGRCHVAI